MAPSCVSKFTNYKQTASWARSFRSCTRRRTDRRRKQRGVEKTGQLPFFLECEALGMCISRCGAAESQIDFMEEHQFIETKKACSIRARSFCILQKFGREEQSLGVTQHTHPHKRGFHGPKFEGRIQEDTLATEAWIRTEPQSPLLRKFWCLPAPQSIKHVAREFVVDSGAAMHMLSRKGLNAAELETPRVSRNCRQDTHSQDTSVQYSLITARTAQLMRLTQELHCHLCL